MEVESSASTFAKVREKFATEAMEGRRRVSPPPKIIPVAFGARWREPVLLIRKHEVEVISGPADAIRYIRHQFLREGGPLCCRAIDICFASLRREADIDVSRVFFLAAHQEHFMTRNVSR